jgi:hypothetical protein
MARPDQTILQQQQTLLPDYQERFLKDLLANVYQTDPTTGQVSGIAAISPLFGQPMRDEQGNPLFRTMDGGFTSDPTQAQTDQFGQPIEAVQGGVPRPDIMQFTPAQQQALQMGAQGIGLYEPMMQRAEETLGTGISAFEQGISGIGATTGAFDPQSYRPFYDPFVEDVIRSTEADIQRQADIERQRIGGAAVQAGAFGGSRQAVAEQELQRNAAQQMADTSARLRSAAFTGAQQQAQSVFENQMARGQSAGQIFGQLGQGIGQLGVQQGALGEASQAAASVTSTRCLISALSSRLSGRLSSMSSARAPLNRHTSPSSASPLCPMSFAVCRPRSRRLRRPAFPGLTPLLRSLARHRP